jgi:CheY-like chemotaxis protein
VFSPGLKIIYDRGGGYWKTLLIDDEDIVRRSASRVLKRLGFEVEVAGDGQEGITLYRKARDLGRPFCAVLMDLTIPGGMGGKSAIERLMEMDPQAKVIVSSGYSDDPVLTKFRDYGFSGVLTKPYKAEELGMVLHKAMLEV